MPKEELKKVLQRLLEEHPIQITLITRGGNKVYYCSLEENKYDLLILDGFHNCSHHEVKLEEILNENDIHCYVILPEQNDKFISEYDALDLTLRRKFKGWKFENKDCLYVIYC